MMVAIGFVGSSAVAQGRYPPNSWETWRNPGRIDRIVVTNYETFVVAQNGIWVWDRLHERWDVPYTIVQSFSEAINLSNIQSIHLEGTEHLFVKTRDGVIVREGRDRNWSRMVFSDSIPYDTSLTIPIKPHLENWMAPPQWTIFPDGRALYSDDNWYHWRNAFIDNRSDLWSIIDNVGVVHGRDQSHRWSMNQLGPSVSTIKSIARNRNGWVVASGGAGISFFIESNREWTWCKPLANRFQLSSRAINDVAVTDGDTYWLATNIGVLTGRQDNPDWDLIDDFRSIHVSSILPTPYGIACGTDRGIEMIGPNRSIHILYESSNRVLNVNQLAIDSDTLFCATNLGMLKIILTSGQTSFLPGPPGIASDSWMSIAVTPSEMWVGGYRGAAAFDRSSGKWASWSSSTYFNDSSINAIAATDSTVWLGGSKGLFRIDRDPSGRLENDPNAKVSPRVNRYTVKDGLPENEIYRIVLDGNRLVMATQGGFCTFRYLHEGRILE